MTRRILKFIAVPLLMAGLFFSPRTALADCTSPTGSQGEIFYNGDFKIMQFCDGTDWIGMYGGSGSGGAGVTDGDKGDINVSGSGASWMIDDDLLDFTEFKDALILDESTDISITGSYVLSLTNSGTGNSFVVNDQASDATPFVIDAGGNVGIGISTPTQALDVFGKTASNTFIAKPVTGAAAPIGGSGGSGGGSGIQVLTTTARDAISSPATGLVIYNTTTAQLEVYSGSAWGAVASAGSIPSGRAERTTSFSVPTGGSVVVVSNYDTVSQTGAEFSQSTGLLQPTASGRYLVTASLYGGAASDVMMSICKETGGVCVTAAPAASSGAGYYANTSYIVGLNGTTEYARVILQNYSGSSKTINNVKISWTRLDGLGSSSGGGSSASGTAGYVQLSDGSGAFASSSTSAGQQLVWDTTNHRLGIGTAAPGSLLHISDATADPSFYITGKSASNVASDIYLSRTSSGAGVATGPNIRFDDGTATNTSLVQNSQGALTFWNYGSGSWQERLRIAANGRVGIGTNSPAWPLHISDPIAPVIQLQEVDSSGNAFIGVDGNSLFIRRGTIGTPDAMTITSTGTVGMGAGSLGVGTIAPTNPFVVDGTPQGSNDSTVVLYTSAANDAFSIMPWSGITYLGSGVYYKDSAWVHDGFNSYSALLGVSGSSGGQWYASSNSSASWNLATGVTLWNPSGVLVGASSRSFKEGFEKLDPNTILGGIARLDIDKWQYTHEPGNVRHIGPVAEDWHQTFGTGDSDKYIPVTDGIGVALVGIQALKAENDNLRSELRATNERFEKLRAEIEALKADR